MGLVDKLKRLNKRGKRDLALLMSVTILAGANGLNSCSGNKDKKKLYLVDIKDEYQDELFLKNKDGNFLELMDSNTDSLLAITDTNKIKDDEYYYVILVNNEGKMQTGYVKGKFLDSKVLDTEKFFGDLYTNEAIIANGDGVWLRDEARVDKDTEHAILLNYGQDVVASDITYTNKEDSYLWTENIAYVDGEIKVGFIAEDFVVSKDFNKIKGKRFLVKTVNGGSINLRETGNDNGNVICEISDGSEVVLLEGFPSVSDGEHDWFYVAVNTDEGVKLGYACATFYSKESGVVHYLEEKDKDKTVEVEEGLIPLKVNTSKDGGVALKLRNGIGTSSDIISELNNDTVIYTHDKYLLELGNNVDDDGRKWLKVILVTGETGYVCYDYVEFREKKQEKNDNVYTLTFGNEGQKEGYFGIDVDCYIDYKAFEKILQNNFYVEDKEKGFSSNCKPSFVIIKLGATYYGRNYEKDNIVCCRNQENVDKLVNLCEKYEVPYGFYYYSQAITTNEADTEVDFIKNEYNRYKNNNYNVLPIYYDYESDGEDRRLVTYANDGQRREELANVLNYAMNKLRIETEAEVCLYSSINALDTIFDFDILEDVNKQNCWVVEWDSEAHSNNYVSKYPKVVENIGLRQIAGDKTLGDIQVDYDFIDKVYFENILKNRLGISNIIR